MKFNRGDLVWFLGSPHNRKYLGIIVKIGSPKDRDGETRYQVLWHDEMLDWYHHEIIELAL
jgi:hypothetical protein